MNEQEYEDFQHEQEIELIDLETPREDDPQEHNGVTTPPADPVLLSLHLQRTSHQRRRLILTASVIVLIVLVILGSSAAMRNAALGFFLGHTPTPASSLTPSTDIFYTAGIPPWG